MQLYTIAGKKDGFGSQYQAIMSGIAICAKKGYTYVHTPFKKIDHGGNVDELNKFIGLKNDTTYDENALKNMITEEYSKEVHDSENPSIYYTDAVLKRIREAYYSTEKPKISDVDIAIHIRRGDVKSDDPDGRYITNTIYLKAINALKKIYPTYKILIFSQGTPEDFKELGLNENNFRLNEPIRTTFHSLVSAKVLVMSKSSLSYSAAILNRNKVYYQPFWHKPLDNWINIDSLQVGGRHTSKKNKRTKGLYTVKYKRFHGGSNTKIKFIDWWQFDTTEIYNNTVAYFEAFFKGCENTFDVIELYSVLSSEKALPPKSSNNILRVQYSGESHFRDPSMFDINSIPGEHPQGYNFVPIPYLHIDMYMQKVNTADLLVKRTHTNANRKFCLFSVSNPNGQERIHFFNELTKYKKVDSCGKVLNNMGLKCPGNSYTAEYHDFIKQYKFMICFENSSVKNYLTEKVLNAYKGGTIPIYWGCPNIDEFVNLDAILYLKPGYSQEDVTALIDEIKRLDADDALYKKKYESIFFKNGVLPDKLNTAKINEQMCKSINTIRTTQTGGKINPIIYRGGNMDTPLISGFEFRNTCKFNMDNRYPLVPYDSTIVEGDRVFLKISDIPTFLQNPPAKKVTLVIHNSDETFDDRLMESVRPHVNKVYAANCSAKDAVQIPLGFRDNQATSHTVLSDIRNDTSKTGNKSILCLVNFLIHTNGDERGKARDAFKGKPWATLSENYMNFDNTRAGLQSDPEIKRIRAEYYAQLKQTKFVICPPGTGIDTHRVYESLYFGAIPIIKTSFLDPLYEKVGNCWIVKDWSEVTEEECNRRWASRKDIPFKMHIADWNSMNGGKPKKSPLKTRRRLYQKRRTKHIKYGGSNIEKKIFHFYTNSHYGDNILNLKFLFNISSILKEKNIQIHYYYNTEYCKNKDELDRYVNSDTVMLHPSSEKPPSAIEIWMGNDIDGVNHNNFDIYISLLYKKILKHMKLDNLNIDTSLYQNEPYLQEIYNRLDPKFKGIDILIINSKPQSAQFDYNKEIFDTMCMKLSNKYRVVTTEPVNDSIPSTIRDGLKMQDIGAISTHVNYIIGVYTAPIIPTLNKRTYENIKKWILFASTGIKHSEPKTVIISNSKEVNNIEKYLV